MYEMIYAFAACAGRERILFGDSAPSAREAFARSLVGPAFPELWFELPLAGKPWFDLHALTARETLDAQTPIDAETCGGVPAAFAWFAKQDDGVRQLALSWDTGSGNIEHPAVQLLKRAYDTQITCDFLEAAGRPDAVEASRTFEGRLPQGWFPCYSGVFPMRKEPFLRVECIPTRSMQEAYAADPGLLATHLRQAGMEDVGETVLERCQILAATPFQLEFQFDVTPEGAAGRTFSASVRFSEPPGDEQWASFDVDGAAGSLMRRVEEWGLADERWRLLEGTVFAKRLKRGAEDHLLWCFPAFLKLRWIDGEPLDAKAYLIASAQ